MTDFRKDIYDTYSTALDEKAVRAYWSTWDFRYLPLLEEVDRGERILELGCGPGYMLEYLGKKGFSRVKGIDISKEQVRIAKSRGQSAKTADVFRFLKLTKAGYGVIIAMDFVEHFSKDELPGLFRDIHRALKDDGILIVQTPNGEGLHSRHIIHGDLTHLTIFTQGSLEQILRITGFGDLRFFETAPVPTGVKGRVRAMMWALIKARANATQMIEVGRRQEIWTENIICFCQKK